MANITEILGTDSISASRPIINQNFNLINDEVADITALLDPTTGVIQGISSATVAALSVINNTSTIALFSTTGIDLNVDVEINARITMAGQIVKSGADGDPNMQTGTPTPGSLQESTYFVADTFSLPAAENGQEVTIISIVDTEVDVTTQGGVNLGAASIQLNNRYSTVTLRYFEGNTANIWFVIASYNADIPPL